MCAAGLEGSTADDVAKEVAIYRAHKASPVVIATDGRPLASALHVLPVPRPTRRWRSCCRPWPATCSVRGGAGHRRPGAAAARGAGRDRGGTVGDDARAPWSADGETVLQRLRIDLQPVTRRYSDELRVGSYDGQLEASTVRLTQLFRYVLGVIPLDAYQIDEGKVGTPWSSSTT